MITGIFFFLVLFLPSSFILFLLFSKNLPLRSATFLYKISTGWLVILLYTFLLFLIYDGVKFLNKFWTFIPSDILASNYVILFIICLVAILCLYGYMNYLDKRRIHLKIMTNKTKINLLRDSSVLIDDSFYLVGRDDRTNINRKSLKELIENLDKTKPILVLDHQPYHLEESEINQVDIQFSGHTHQGQIWPISLLTNALFEKSHGYLKKGNTHYYVSSGIGIWGGRYRIGTYSEYVVIDFVQNIL